MWVVQIKNSGVFEGDRLKALASRIGRFYAENERGLPSVEYIFNDRNEKEYPALISALEDRIEDSFNDQLEDEKDGAEYKRQVCNYYNSTRL